MGSRAGKHRLTPQANPGRWPAKRGAPAGTGSRRARVTHSVIAGVGLGRPHWQWPLGRLGAGRTCRRGSSRADPGQPAVGARSSCASAAGTGAAADGGCRPGALLPVLSASECRGSLEKDKPKLSCPSFLKKKISRAYFAQKKVKGVSFKDLKDFGPTVASAKIPEAFPHISSPKTENWLFLTFQFFKFFKFLTSLSSFNFNLFHGLLKSPHRLKEH